MPAFGVAVLAGHFALLLTLCLFGLHRLSMVFRWVRYRNTRPPASRPFAQLPRITVQIPLYNERLVAKRIVDACVALDYPRELLQIQIVDDSTDDTSEIVAWEVALHRANGVDITHVRRAGRQGFKAGALRDAMPSATGEFIAIFDADFVPPPDILKESIDCFSDPRIGMVQFRWEHLNRYSSLFTESQAMMLDAHFGLEQQVRYASNKLFNFNGTAGIWRTRAILDAGNWSADTLTEDLDLSFRAQLRGWKMLYLNDLKCPGEIPSDMNAFKNQQHRWAKGGIQVMLKMLGTVWKAPLGLTKKLEATFHLSNNLAYLVMLSDTIFFLIPSLWVREQYQIEYSLWFDLPLLAIASGGHLVYLFFGQVALGHSKWTALLHVPLLMLLGIQLAFNNAKAALEALLGRQSEFVRTPKSGEQAPSKSHRSNLGRQLYNAVIPRSAAVELLIALVYMVVLAWAVENRIWFMVPFVLLLIAGFITTAVSNLKSRLFTGEYRLFDFPADSRKPFTAYSGVLLAAVVITAGSFLLQDVHQGLSVIPKSALGIATVTQFSLLGICMLLAWRLSPATDSLRDHAALLIVAVVLHLILIPVEPYTSNDMGRYLFDGYIASSGMDPYTMSHDAIELDRVREAWAPPVEHLQYVTLYPPLALALFSFAASFGPEAAPWIWKTMAALAGIATLWLGAAVLRNAGSLRHLPLIALSPILILEAGVGGHVDGFSALAVALSIVALQAGNLFMAGVFIGAGALIKIHPLMLLLPLLFSRGNWRGAFRLSAATLGTIAAGYGLAFAMGLTPIGSIQVFFEKFRFGSLWYTVVEPLAGTGLTAASALVLFVAGALAIAAYAHRQRTGHLSPKLLIAMQAALLLPLLIGPVVYPWYLSPVIPLLALAPNLFVLTWVCLLPLSYEVLGRFACCNLWTPADWPLVLLAVGMGVSLLLAFLRNDHQSPANGDPIIRHR